MTFDSWQVVQIVKKGWTLVPRMLGDIGILDVDSRKARKRNEMNLLFFESNLLEKPGLHFFEDFVVSVDVPVCIVHFVNGDDQTFDTLCFHKHGVLTSLTALFKS